ncbi:MAG: porphobilinogen synthase [Candidatus Methanoplasma sp.]|jgi:porphobilinogen synthase|nr:porphobilinogen synthase [Candidatus Methanoplasma sp.]
MFPDTRMRRIRRNPALRSLVRETSLQKDKLILPLFFDETIDRRREIPSMPGIYNNPLSDVESVISRAAGEGIGSVLLFGVPGKKDGVGSGAYADDGVVQKAIKRTKDVSDVLVIADLCLCEYTDHGHCGCISHGDVDNDATLELYAETAVSLASAGADVVAPSGMMDGQVAAIRRALDDAGLKDTAIMAYSAKYKSSFYGPFRDAVHSAPSKGDRSGYQMQWGNRREAMQEMFLDMEEGADILMVKPAMPYLDIIREARDRFDLPIAAYQVSGEYSMIKAAAANGWLNENDAVMESLTSLFRSGADMAITYFAESVAKELDR